MEANGKVVLVAKSRVRGDADDGEGGGAQKLGSFFQAQLLQELPNRLSAFLTKQVLDVGNGIPDRFRNCDGGKIVRVVFTQKFHDLTANPITFVGLARQLPTRIGKRKNHVPKRTQGGKQFVNGRYIVGKLAKIRQKFGVFL